MRRCLLFLPLVLSLLIASPVLALDLDVSGSLQFEGVYNENATLQKSDSADSFREMRLRVLTEAQITDNIKIITRFDALDKVLSSRDSAFDNNEDDDNFDFDRAYAEIITPIGLLSIGRMQGVVWGTSWSDDEADTDRIKLVTPIAIGENKLYIGAVAEKVTENDKGVELSSKDNDKYYIGATYKTKKYSTGLLSAFYNFHLFQDPQQAKLKTDLDNAGGEAQATADGTTAALLKAEAQRLGNDASNYADLAAAVAADGGFGSNLFNQYAALAATSKTQAEAIAAQAGQVVANSDALQAAAALQALPRGATTEAKVFLLAPYFDGKFGPLGITTELDYIFGEAEYDTNNTERDVEGYAWFGELRYDIADFTLQAGYAITSGDADYDDDDIGSMGYVAPGSDWAKAFILTSDEHGMNTTLGDGLGNLVGDGFGTAYTAVLDGYRMIYAGVNYTCFDDTVNLGALIASSQADDTPGNVDDDHGIEYDLTLTWNIMDNLVYTGVAAYLQAGDYWKERSGNPNAAEDTYALYHRLELFF
ncbi:hypothetical protein [Desulfoluna spongiiphila]|uniref:Alginate export n=1 Tax=Desulfoluna spongiiphila TaxID=419481 RepID=A0A1G5FQE7_9BACT|nr:hypothetical protein [Desulfoluna spongiiphila]SCY41479.1 hypothetical protein SAMN05216233_108215 [Desulfoluna spongiiphila]